MSPAFRPIDHHVNYNETRVLTEDEAALSAGMVGFPTANEITAPVTNP